MKKYALLFLVAFIGMVSACGSEDKKQTTEVTCNDCICDESGCVCKDCPKCDANGCLCDLEGNCECDCICDGDVKPDKPDNDNDAGNGCDGGACPPPPKGIK